MKILGVRIDEVSLKQAREKVREFLNSDGQYKIFTPNPEMLVSAQKDDYFKQILNKGDLNLPDGKGLQLVSKGKLKVIPGSDFTINICKIAEELDKTVYLLGSRSEEVVKKTREKLINQFSKLNIVGCDPGSNIVIKENNQIKVENNTEVLDGINKVKPDILFVAFAFGKQEKWISEFLPKIPSVKIAMGVGGTFDFISGNIKRAPKWVRTIWMEWLWRLIRQPKRIKRIINAVIVFPYLVLKNKINN